ncbi:hypothetical protein [Brachybacterium alimentarium]|uniref:hypothetical protein n=1 Tax=Brachybacterium alimentarium TaxID=47845 RepID=UPI003FD0EA5E
MAEQEKTPGELRSDLMRETEEALLRAIKESARKYPQPDSLKALGEAYSLVMASKSSLSSAGAKPSGRAVSSR